MRKHYLKICTHDTIAMLQSMYVHKLSLLVVLQPLMKFNTVFLKKTQFSKHVAVYHVVTAWSVTTATAFALIMQLSRKVLVKAMSSTTTTAKAVVYVLKNVLAVTSRWFQKRFSSFLKSKHQIRGSKDPLFCNLILICMSFL